MAQKLNTDTSIVDYLKSTKEDSSFAARKALAVEQGIVKNAKDYTGTAAQNTALLKAVKADDGAGAKAKAEADAKAKATAAAKAKADADAAAKAKAAAAAKVKAAVTAALPSVASAISTGAQTAVGKAPAVTVPDVTPTPTSTYVPTTSMPPALNGNVLGGVNTTVTTGTNSTATQVVDNLTQLIATAMPNAAQYTYKEFEKIAVDNPQLKSAQELAKLYGLDYDLKSIYDTLIKSVDAGYDARYNQQAQVEGKYYDNAATAQNVLTDTLRKQQSQAILAGSNKGIQAAQALSAMLGTSQQFAATATQLAMDRQQIGKEQAAAQAQTGEKAFNAYTAMGQQLADVSKNLYSSDVSKQVGQLDYNASISTANAQLQAQSMASRAQWETTLASNIASAYQAYYNGQITLEQARIQSNAAIESAKVYGLDAASVTAAANQAIAQTNKEATMYASDSNYNATMGAAGLGYSATTGAAGIAAGATERAAQISADSYVDTANINNNNKGAQANLVTGLIAGVNTQAVTVADAQQALDGYLAAGLIDQTTYTATKGIINTKAPTVTTPGITIKPSTNTGVDGVSGAQAADPSKQVVVVPPKKELWQNDLSPGGGWQK